MNRRTNLSQHLVTEFGRLPHNNQIIFTPSQVKIRITNKVPKDDANVQGLLKNEDEAVFPDISAELPGGELEAEEQDCAPVLDEPETDFRELAEAALQNAGINSNDRIRTACEAAARGCC